MEMKYYQFFKIFTLRILTSIDCPDVEQNIGDVCRDMAGAAGTLNLECECILFDCQDLMANIGEACRNGTTVNTNCECE